MNNAEKELIKRLVDKLATKIKATKKQLEKQIFVSESDKCAKEAFNDEQFDYYYELTNSMSCFLDYRILQKVDEAMGKLKL